MRKKWGRVVALFICATLSLTGCRGGDSAKSLEIAKQGQTASKEMVRYFTELKAYNEDSLLLEVFGQSRTIERRQKLTQSLQSRLAVAKAFEATYASLEALSAYDAHAEISGAASGLATSLNKLLPLVEAPTIPVDLFSWFFAELKAAQQDRDAKRGALALRWALSDWICIYTLEAGDLKPAAVQHRNKILPCPQGRTQITFSTEALSRAVYLGNGTTEATPAVSPQGPSAYGEVALSYYGDSISYFSSIMQEEKIPTVSSNPFGADRKGLDIIWTLESSNSPAVKMRAFELHSLRALQRLDENIRTSSEIKEALVKLLKKHDELFPDYGSHPPLDDEVRSKLEKNNPKLLEMLEGSSHEQK